MRRARSKKLAIMILFTFMATLFAAVPMAQAAGISVNVAKAPSYDKDSTDIQTLGTIQIKEDKDFPGDLETGDVFVVTFPSGVKLDKTSTAVYAVDLVEPLGKENVTFSGDYTLNIELPTMDPEVAETVKIVPRVKFDGFDGGDVVIEIDGLDSAVPSLTKVIGRGVSGGTETIALETKTIGDGSDKELGRIRITEAAIGSLSSNETITLTLPNDYTWNDAMKSKESPPSDGYVNVVALGGFTNANIASVNIQEGDTKKLDIEFNANTATTRGIIEITPIVDVDSDADFGEIEIDVEGTQNVDDATVVVGKLADFGITLEAKDEDIKEVVAGQKDQKLTKIVIEENVAGSLISGRNIEIELPTGVKFFSTDGSVANVKVVSGDNIFGTKIVKDSDTLRIPVTGTSGSKVKLEIEIKKVNIAADKTGDVVVEVKGSAGVEGEVIVGKVVPSITASVEAVDVKLGVKGQTINDITLAEGKKGSLKKDGDSSLILRTPGGVTWAETPDIEVVEGNVDLGDASIDATDRNLTIPIDSESSRVSTIKISGIKLNVDRTVPEGPVNLSVMGKAVAESAKEYNEDKEKFAFEADEAGKILVANCVTPAPKDTLATAVFTIGEPAFTVNGVEMTMDVAPYIKNDRTFLPVRFVSNAVGVANENIYWNDATKTVTIIKGERAVQMTIGSKIMKINGAEIAIDVAPEIKADRTMLPIRALSTALGCEILWDDATRTVTINY
ncbi:MAG: copper amine oxidase N-terminal domain-containing protein [Bacteroidales bacterium]